MPGGGIVFVKHNNIFYKPNMKTGVVHKVTLSGLQGTIYNGVADWLYEGCYKYQRNTTSSFQTFQRKFLVKVKHSGFPQMAPD